jgi:hypothetical protein
MQQESRSSRFAQNIIVLHKGRQKCKNRLRFIRSAKYTCKERHYNSEEKLISNFLDYKANEFAYFPNTNTAPGIKAKLHSTKQNTKLTTGTGSGKHTV